MSSTNSLIRPIAAVACTLALVGASACGSSEPSGDDGSPTPTPSVSAAATEPAPIPKVSATPLDGPLTIDNPMEGDTSWIAYQWGDPEGIWIMHPDGSDNRQIAAAAKGEELLPDWSPDGSTIVFATRGDGTHEEPLHLYDLATDEVRQLFDCTYPECLGADEPAFSPDGTEVAFVRYLGPFTDDELPSDCGIWIGNVATGEQRQVTSNEDCDREYFPRWSPDGSQLTYWRWREDNGITVGTAVFVINVDGTGERQLTAWQDMMGDPDWSPDGQWILFNDHPLRAFTYDPPVVSNLYRMRPDGSEVEALTSFHESQLRATQARFRRDGEWIVFTGQDGQTGRRKLYIMPAGGGAPFRVSVSGEQTHGAWQPAP